MTYTKPAVAVIIPTYNRKESLLRTLESLGAQTLPLDQFEVIVIDDGSTDDTPNVADLHFPYACRYVRQKNQGATVARNFGATLTEAETLVFIDDDVTISPQAIESLAEVFSQHPKSLVMGTLIQRNSDGASIYASTLFASPSHAAPNHDLIEIHFSDFNTELLSCRRSDFFALGMLQDPTMGHGWPNWDDVDFAYRAHLRGFQLLQSGGAIGEHWDHSISDWVTACQRWYRASKSAVWLLKRHCALESEIPMLYDKTPLTWGKDPPRLIARKLARRLLSSSPIKGATQEIVGILEKKYPSPVVLGRLYYLLHGAYMFQGYRDGLQQFKLVRAEV